MGDIIFKAIFSFLAFYFITGLLTYLYKFLELKKEFHNTLNNLGSVLLADVVVKNQEMLYKQIELAILGVAGDKKVKYSDSFKALVINKLENQISKSISLLDSVFFDKHRGIAISEMIDCVFYRLVKDGYIDTED